jgi:hypothetical protein
VPKDFAVTGKEETLKVQVIYETDELYGKVTDSREIVVSRQ